MPASNTFRLAEPGEGETILRVTSSAFGREPGSTKYERDRERIEAHLNEYYVVCEGEAIVGALHVSLDDIRVGRSIVTKADVGEVAIVAERHGQGLGSSMMSAIVATLKADGIHLSRLGGYRRFYERFGWVPFPRGYVDFALSGLTSRGGFTDPVTYLDRPDEDAKIRPYDGSRDTEACADLYRAFNRSRTGARAGKTFSRSSDDPWRIVYEDERTVLAYLFASENPPPHTRLTSAVSIQDAACDPNRPAALGEVIRYTLRRASMAGAATVSARLPLDPSLYDLYRDSSTGFVPSLWQSSEGGNMLQVLNLRLLMEAVRVTLEARLRGTDVEEGDVSIDVHDQVVSVSWRGGKLRVSDVVSDTIALSQEGFFRLLLGLTAVEQVIADPSAGRGLLAAMFPVQGTATGIWG